MSEALALPPPVTIAAFDRFLATQRDDTAWELVAGQVEAMTNPTLDHAEIVDNLGTALRAAMPADRSCRVARGDVRLQLSDDVRGIYAPLPDLMVWCGPKIGARNFVTTPLIVVEVLSPSSMDSDRGAKLRFYKTGLQTMRHIVLIYQDQMRVELYNRVASGWDLFTLTKPDDLLILPALLFELPLAALYAGVDAGTG